jgi:hypothetical protein
VANSHGLSRLPGAGCLVCRADWLWCADLRQCPPGAVVGQAEVDEPAQVKRGGSVVQPMVISADAAVAQPAIAAGQPGDGPFDHGPVLAVVRLPIRITSSPAGRRVDGRPTGRP